MGPFPIAIRHRLLHQMVRSRNFGYHHREKMYEASFGQTSSVGMGSLESWTQITGKQFDKDSIRDFCSQLGIKNHYSPPLSPFDHPQANDQVEVTNWPSSKIIKTQLEGTKGICPEELPSILWAYRTTTVRTPIGETSFWLAYESETVIPAEVGLTSYIVDNHNESRNDKVMRLQLDLEDEVRVTAE